jgi:hypothetical protein
MKKGTTSQRDRKCGRPPCAATPQQAKELRARGMSLRQIARALRVGKTSVERLLSTPGGEQHSQDPSHQADHLATIRPNLALEE